MGTSGPCNICACHRQYKPYSCSDTLSFRAACMKGTLRADKLNITLDFSDCPHERTTPVCAHCEQRQGLRSITFFLRYPLHRSHVACSPSSSLLVPLVSTCHSNGLFKDILPATKRRMVTTCAG